MATQDNTSGLLSKVVKFVRNPNTDWSDLAKEESVQDSEQGKQTLKLMIERKRHNDGVRRREFDQLRKLRQASVVTKAELVKNPNDFRGTTGYSDLGERATTLKKIDEIEAQMSHQWWKGRSQSGVAPSFESSARTTLSRRLSDAQRPSGLRSTFATTQNSDLMASSEDALTQAGFDKPLDFQPTVVGVALSAPESRGFDVSSNSVFSDSKMMSVDMGQNLSDPELEEAAIRYANGDDDGAEEVLQAALQNQGALAEAFEVWLLALFDFYRCTGQQDKFEELALESAQRFGRSAPQWFSTPQALGLTALHAPQPLQAANPAASTNTWHCPAELDEKSVARLRALNPEGGKSVCADWHDLQSITPTAAPQLAGLLAFWCEQPMRLCFEGVESLQLLLQACTPTGDRGVPFCWWQSRLDLLRLLRLPEEFEQVALDFCVTYELSPPSWGTPRCELVARTATEFNDLPMGTALPDSEGGWQNDVSSLSLSPASTQPAQDMALTGDVMGDIESLTSSWQAACRQPGVCLVSCAQLIRVDFSAAGSLLNWVAHMEAQGARVEFRDVPRLVGAFFNLIGINEHARVVARAN